jgi:hypothetical protein
MLVAIFAQGTHGAVWTIRQHLHLTPLRVPGVGDIFSSAIEISVCDLVPARQTRAAGNPTADDALALVEQNSTDQPPGRWGAPPAVGAGVRAAQRIHPTVG